MNSELWCILVTWRLGGNFSLSLQLEMLKYDISSFLLLIMNGRKFQSVFICAICGGNDSFAFLASWRETGLSRAKNAENAEKKT